MTPRTRAIEGGVALGLLALASACGGGYRAATPAGGGGDPAKLGDGGGLVEAAALPYAIVDGHTGHAVADAEFWVRLGGARAVCAGEEHPSPHDHWAQLQIVDHLTAPPRGGAGLAVGMEMVQQPFQGVLDDWTGARIDDAALLSRTGWVERWGYDFAMYRPVLALARTRGAALVALNAPSELVKKVAHVGVEGLGADDKARLPQLVLDDAQHRAWFDRVMASMDEEGDGHGHAHGHGEAADPHAADAQTAASPMPPADAVYAAQVVWDESMADAAARWLAHGQRIVILAGDGHCHDSAIVRRLQRRGVAPVVSVRPVVDDGHGNVAAALAEGINDYLFVMTPPAGR